MNVSMATVKREMDLLDDDMLDTYEALSEGEAVQYILEDEKDEWLELKGKLLKLEAARRPLIYKVFVKGEHRVVQGAMHLSHY